MQGVHDLTRYLLNKGLYVRTFGPSRAVIGVRVPAFLEDEPRIESTRFSRTVNIDRCDFEDETVYIEDLSHLEWTGEQWHFWNRISNFFGAPNLDVIHYLCESQERIIEVIENYYFRLPVAVGDWLFPVYQQPTWRLDRIIAAVQNVTIMGFIELGQMMQNGIAQLHLHPHKKGQIWRDPACDQFLFYNAPRLNANALRLHLRYDCLRAYTCRELSDVEQRELAEELARQAFGPLEEHED